MGRLSPFFGALGVLGFVALHACSSDEAGTGDDGKKGGGGGGAGGSGGDAGAPEGGTSGVSGKGTGGSGDGGVSGFGGTAGSSKGGNAGAAGQAGEPAGGASGDAGGGAGGQGGMGATGPGDTCNACVDDNATTLKADCQTSPSCRQWMQCARGCSDSACLDDCDAANPSVAPYRYAIYGALCSSCDTECSELALCDRECVDNVNLGTTDTPPPNLAATGLYASPTATPDQVAPYARPFHPKYELWSDGAQKRRWAYIPKCSRIGTEGMNHWIFPVGTRMWKEFVIPASSGNGTRVETRFIHRFNDTESGWLYATYQWPASNANPNPTAADATLVDVGGVQNANGTAHDIPARAQCPQCHSNGPGPFPDKLLGFAAIQLSHQEDGVTIRELADGGWLTFPAAAQGIGGGLARNGYNPPGATMEEQKALGYLHANCGHCHNGATTYGQTAQTPAARLRLMIGFMDTVQVTDTWTTLLDKPTTNAQFPGCDRIDPGHPEYSEVVMRMGRRGSLQMPPLATEIVHTTALDGIKAWITSMPSVGATTCATPP